MCSIADDVADHLREHVSHVVGVAEALAWAAFGQGIPCSIVGVASEGGTILGHVGEAIGRGGVGGHAVG